MRIFNELIKKIGDDLGIKVSFISDNWVTILEKNGETHCIQGYKFDLNNHGIGNIIDDKGLFFDLLKHKNIPIIEHFIIFKDYNKEEVLNYFKKNNNILVIKGNIGTCGEQVFKVSDETNLFKTIDNLFLSQFSISLCPFYDIKNEYRVILLNKKPRIVYGKIRPSIIGDGIKSIRELAIEFNDYYRDKKIDNEDYVPLNGEEILLNFKFNLSMGSKMFVNIDLSLSKELEGLAFKAIEGLDVNFCSVDIIQTVDNELLIMEANSGIMMDNYIRFMGNEGYNVAYNLYKDAVKLMFKM